MAVLPIRDAGLDKAWVLSTLFLPTATKENWATWFQAAGVDRPVEPTGPYIGDASAILQAVVDGQGVAFGRAVLMSDDNQAGRIIAPFELQLDSLFSYWFVTSLNREPESIVIAVRDWLKSAFSKN